MRPILLVAFCIALSACRLPGEFPTPENQCHFDAELETRRQLSAITESTPLIESIFVNGELRWQADHPTSLQLQPEDEITLIGQHFGQGPHIDFSKIMIGNARVLEEDLKMYVQKMAIKEQVNYETPELHDEWLSDIQEWHDNRVRFKVPLHAQTGSLRLQVQKRIRYNPSLMDQQQPHLVVDAQEKRVIDADDQFEYECDVVSVLGEPRWTQAIPVKINNPKLPDLIAQGEAAFWAYDYNIGLAHSVRRLDWNAIFAKKSYDPVTKTMATDLKTLFGAFATLPGEVPEVAVKPYYFAPYPMPNPIPGHLTRTPQKRSGMTRNSGYAGYRSAESSHPYQGDGEWIGFNCASCHGYRIQYESTPGQLTTKIFPGLPNPYWSMKWSVLQHNNEAFVGIYGNEPAPEWAPMPGRIAKDMLIYHIPNGVGEHNIVRNNGEGSLTDNDYQFSPIAIPNVTYHLPIRRSLSHTESYVGFEGSYIHSEEPDGAMGSMKADWLKALTAYMSVLDQDDGLLQSIGMYRDLHARQRFSTYGIPNNIQEGHFVQFGWQQFPKLVAQVKTGKAIFKRDCASCHNDGFNAYTNEQMYPLSEVGRFFSPTIYQRETQSIRVAYLRNLYWLQHRGLLSDGHVATLGDLVNPERCSPGSDLYKAYYELHPSNPPAWRPDFPPPYPSTNTRGDVFRVPKSPITTALGRERNRFIERHPYFTEVSWDKEHYYWDYQKMREALGPKELKTDNPIGLPATPHPWCAKKSEDVEALVAYLLTL